MKETRTRARTKAPGSGNRVAPQHTRSSPFPINTTNLTNGDRDEPEPIRPVSGRQNEGWAYLAGVDLHPMWLEPYVLGPGSPKYLERIYPVPPSTRAPEDNAYVDSASSDKLDQHTTPTHDHGHQVSQPGANHEGNPTEYAATLTNPANSQLIRDRSATQEQADPRNSEELGFANPCGLDHQAPSLPSSDGDELKDQPATPTLHQAAAADKNTPADLHATPTTSEADWASWPNADMNIDIEITDVQDSASLEVGETHGTPIAAAEEQLVVVDSQPEHVEQEQSTSLAFLAPQTTSEDLVASVNASGFSMDVVLGVLAFARNLPLQSSPSTPTSDMNLPPSAFQVGSNVPADAAHPSSPGRKADNAPRAGSTKSGAPKQRSHNLKPYDCPTKPKQKRKSKPSIDQFDPDHVNPLWLTCPRFDCKRKLELQPQDWYETWAEEVLVQDLWVHMELEHDLSWEHAKCKWPVVQIEPWSCRRCGYECRSKGVMVRHMNNHCKGEMEKHRKCIGARPLEIPGRLELTQTRK